jgi:hypothetical protein
LRTTRKWWPGVYQQTASVLTSSAVGEPGWFHPLVDRLQVWMKRWICVTLPVSMWRSCFPQQHNVAGNSRQAILPLRCRFFNAWVTWQVLKTVLLDQPRPDADKPQCWTSVCRKEFLGVAVLTSVIKERRLSLRLSSLT